ncbi:hypothetical protein ACTVZO_41765 [Streptomyces sp. IBSNAI002]
MTFLKDSCNPGRTDWEPPPSSWWPVWQPQLLPPPAAWVQRL